MYCAQCGKEYSETVNFCCQCGAAMAAKPLPKKKLSLSRRNKKIAGVCGGFAEYLDIDPTLVRVVWVATALLVGWGFLAYLVAWIVMPQAAPGDEAVSSVPSPAPQPAPNHS